MKSSIKTKFIFGFIFVLSFILCQQFINFFALQSFNLLIVEGTFEPDAKLHFRSSNGLYAINEKTQINSGVLPKKHSQRLKFQLNNRTISTFSLDIVHHGKPFKIEQIALASHFSNNETKWSDSEMTNAFDIWLNDDKRTTHYIIKNAVKGQNHFLAWVVPAFISLCLLLLIPFANWREFPAIKDLLSNQQKRNQSNLASLDGFRGLAALLVLLQHTATPMKGAGNLGVWMFFVLSGFLLTKTFVVDPQKNLNFGNLLLFMQRRFRRIVPMYFFLISCIFLLTYRYDNAIRHYLFIQGDGHFWTILQEMYFYLLLPILTTVAYLICRGRALFTIIFLLVCAWLWQHYGTSDRFSVYGYNQNMRAYFEVFITGMLGAYFYHGIFLNNKNLQNYSIKYQHIISAIGLTLFALLLCNMLTDWLSFNIPIKKSPLSGAFICLFFILIAALSPQNSIYNRAFSNPFLRYVGIIGYSFYLLHPYAVFLTRNGIEYFLQLPPENVSDIWRILSPLVLTLLFASFTYSFIERPFLTNKKPK